MSIPESLEEKINRVVKEKINIVKYDPKCISLFEQESNFLKSQFPKIIKRIEHFGSTAVPNLSAKPIVDLLVEVSSFKEVKSQIVPKLEKLGYDYFWRPEFDKPPYYTWFIKRDSQGNRTHHIHMVRKDSKLWDRLFFRDYLRINPNIAKEYEKLKTKSSLDHATDREAYSNSKTDFITKITQKAKEYFNNLNKK